MYLFISYFIYSNALSKVDGFWHTSKILCHLAHSNKKISCRRDSARCWWLFPFSSLHPVTFSCCLFSFPPLSISAALKTYSCGVWRKRERLLATCITWSCAWCVVALSWETQHAVGECEESMARCATASDWGVGRGRNTCNWFTALRGTSSRHHDQRSRSIQVWHARQTGSRGWLRLGLLRVTGAHPLLRQVR